MTASQQKILHLCSRISGHPLQYKQLSELSSTFSDWEKLLSEAELEGITPLLHKHLVGSGCHIPVSVRRTLGLLVVRHKRSTEIRNAVLLEVLQRLGQEGIDVLVLKGAALAHTLYPEAFLRPMRDIDLLLKDSEADKGQKILIECGFAVSPAPIPVDHFHLAPLFKSIENITVCIEIHRELFPKCAPFYPRFDFADLLKNSREFGIEGFQARTFGDEDMLWYLYEHGFRVPLPYEGYRLINVADFIGMVEKTVKELPWKDLRYKYPKMCNAVLLMDHFSPWDKQVVDSSFLLRQNISEKTIPKRFQGWPKKKFKSYKREGKGLITILYDTFLPPVWWLRVNYGASTLLGCTICLLTVHPKNVLWWIALHSHFLKSPKNAKGQTSISSPGNLSIFLGRTRSLLSKLKR